MRWLYLLLVFFFVACKGKNSKDNNDSNGNRDKLPESKEKTLREAVTGEWMIARSGRDVTTSTGAEQYEQIKDSIEKVMLLRVVRFADDGSFAYSDTLNRKGQWNLTGTNQIAITAGGPGFEHFRGEQVQFNKKSKRLEITERVDYKGKPVRVIWHLLPLTANDSTDALFSLENQWWRIKPTAPESEQQIKARLAAALTHYSHYYMIVAAHANFFRMDGFIMPLAFYQHALGLKPFDEKSQFATFFYNTEQAKQAHYFIEETLREIAERGLYPRNDDYVIGYAGCMKKMAELLRR